MSFGERRTRLKLDVEGEGGGRILDVVGEGGGGGRESSKLNNFHGLHTCIVS